MLKTTNLTTQENINLSKEITLVAPMDTPLTTLLLANGRTENAGAKIFTWREKSLDTTDNVTVAEGSEATNFVASGRAELNNVLEILMKSVEVSGSAQATVGTGVADLFSSEVNDRLAELKINLEKKLINGVKDDGSISGVRAMDGLLKFVHADNKITAAALTETEIKGLARKLWNQGANAGELYAFVNADLKETIDGLYKDSYNYVHKTNDFGIVVSSVNTNYGTVNFVLDRYMPADKIVAFNLAALGVAFLRQPQFELLAKTGDSIKGMVLTEATLKVASKKAVAEFTLTI